MPLPDGENYARARERRRQKLFRAQRVQWAKDHPEDDRHGTANFYNNYGCRCEACRHAKYLERKGLTARHTPSVYTIEEHRAFGERLCPACRKYLENFGG